MKLLPAIQTALLASVVLALSSCGGAAMDGGDDDGNVSFGGAQDIGQFRDILDRGGIPGEDTLDANGFFNEHYVELPDADCGQALCGHAMVSVGADWRTGDYQAALQISMNSPIDPADLERLPLNLVVVVDTSGSMEADNRLADVKTGLHLLVDQVEAGDRIAIIEYSTEVRVLASLTEPADNDQLHELISGLWPGGSTNLHDGLESGLEMVAAAYDVERQNRVVLLSDGMPTTGITDDASILAMAEGYIADGIGLTTIGVGDMFNVNLMRGLAERGAGNFYYLEDADAIDEVFTDELDYFVTPIALAVDIRVSAGPAYRFGEVVGTKLWQSHSDYGQVFIPAAFLASRTSAVPDPNGRRGGGSAIFVQMHANGATGPIDFNKVAHVELTYRVPGSSEVIEQVIDVTNPYDPGMTPEECYYSHAAMAKNYAVYNIFLALRQATRQAASSYSCALDTLVTLNSVAQRWNLEYEDADVIADIALADTFAANLRAAGGRDGYCDQPYYDDCDDPNCTQEMPMGCSTGGSNAPLGSLLLALGALGMVTRRRD
jgi:Ca-activated chloride channel family protein